MAGLDSQNRFGDDAALQSDNLQGPPYEAGHFEWEMPVLWRVNGTTQPHEIGGWEQTFDLENDGSLIIHKFGKWVRRTVLDQSTHN